MSNQSGIRSQLRSAWRLRPVKIGLAATCAIAIGSLTPAYLPQASPVWSLLQALHLAGQVGRVGGTVLSICGVFALVDAWLRLRRHGLGQVHPLAIVALWVLPFLVSPPIFSHDAYSYGAQGWMIHNGQNPYDGGPGLVPGPFSDYTPWVWRYTPAPYGPLGLQISHVLAVVSGGHPWLAAGLMRLPALAGVVAIVVLLPKLSDRLGFDTATVTWFACLNPILVIDYVGGAHNDAWMMGLVVIGLWLATYRRWWPAAAVVIGLAASIKQPAILAAYVLPGLIRPLAGWRPIKPVLVWAGRALAGVAVAAATFILVSLASGLGFGWWDALGVPGSVGSISPSYLVGSLIQTLASPGNSNYLVATYRVGMIIGGALIVYFACRYALRQPIKALAWSWVALALSASALHSWYLLWGGLLWPFSASRRGLWVGVGTVVLLVTYAGINLGDRNGYFAIIAAVVCLVAWLVQLWIYHIWRARHPRRPGDQLDATIKEAVAHE